MNKMFLLIVLVLGFIPYVAMADESDEVTIRVIDMNDNTTGAVTNTIELPEPSSVHSEQEMNHIDPATNSIPDTVEDNAEMSIHEMEQSGEQQYNEIQNNAADNAKGK